MKCIKRIFCRHKWIKLSKPYLHDMGRTKRVNVECVKCGKVSSKDIFDTPERSWVGDGN